MEDWHDIASLVTGSLSVAALAVIVACLPIYGVVRLFRVMPRFRGHHSWRSDLRPFRWLAGVIFVLVLVTSLLMGSAFSTMCGTSHITEVPSPDARHKLVVFNFDCGATTDFSLDVSLLKAGQGLPKYKTPRILYGHYRQCPIPAGPQRNFEVEWKDSSHVTVFVEALDATAKTQNQDGVEVSFATLR